MKKSMTVFVLLLMIYAFPLQAQWSTNGGVNSLPLTTGGNVGIGTTTPSTMLDLRGGTMQVVNNSTGSYSFLGRFSDPGNDSYFYHLISPNFHILGSNKNGTGLQRKLGFAIGGFDTESDIKMTIDNSGNVGIGTITPSSKLDVRGGTMQVINYSTGTYSYLGRLSDPGNDSYFYHVISPNFHILGSSKNGTGLQRKLGFAIGGTDSESDIKMTIDNSGNVGIGTTTPGSFKLAVEGKIGAREVNVTTTTPWPDYVFEKNHSLPSLEQVKSYIEQNKHLPEIPSAQEIEKNGQNLGEMNMLLLKKIEELTLHAIQQQEQIDLMKKKIELIKNK